MATISSSITPAQYPWLIALGILLLAGSWVWLRPRTGSRLSVPLAFGVWVVPLLLLPPMLSTDAGSYADLGWIMGKGLSPYDVGLGTTGSPFPYGTAWRGSTSVYPPLALVLFGWVVAATGAHWYWSVVAMRVLTLVGVGLLAWSLPRVARRFGIDPVQALWFGLLNPIVLVHGIGGEHVDLLMVGLVGAGLALALEKRWYGLVSSAAVIGLAAAVKQPALLAVPAVAGVWLLSRSGQGRGVKADDAGSLSGPPVSEPGEGPGQVARSWAGLVAASVAAGIVSAAAFVAVSLASGLGFGWLDGSGNPANASQTITPAYLLAQLIDGNVVQLTLIGKAVAAGAVVGLWLTYGRRDPLRFLALAALAFTLGFGVLREWYLVFPAALLGLARPGRWLGPAMWWLVSALAVYGTFREYRRVALLSSFQQSAWLGLIAVAAGVGLWWLSRIVGTRGHAR